MNYTYEKIKRKAVRLVDKLQADITSGRKQIKENYGQKEIGRFMDRELNTNEADENLTYQEKCNIKDVLFKVSSIS